MSLTNNNIASILEMTPQGVGKWKRENRPIISLLDKYFTKEDLEEFLETNKIQKMDMLQYYNKQILVDFFDLLHNCTINVFVDFILFIDFEQLINELDKDGGSISYTITKYYIQYYDYTMNRYKENNNIEDIKSALLSLNGTLQSLTTNHINYLELNFKCNFKNYIDFLIKNKFYEHATKFILYFNLSKYGDFMDENNLFFNVFVYFLKNDLKDKSNEFKFIENFTNLTVDNRKEIINNIKKITQNSTYSNILK